MTYLSFKSIFSFSPFVLINHRRGLQINTEKFVAFFCLKFILFFLFSRETTDHTTQSAKIEHSHAPSSRLDRLENFQVLTLQDSLQHSQDMVLLCALEEANQSVWHSASSLFTPFIYLCSGHTILSGLCRYLSGVWLELRASSCSPATRICFFWPDYTTFWRFIHVHW